MFGISYQTVYYTFSRQGKDSLEVFLRLYEKAYYVPLGASGIGFPVT